MTTDWMPDGTVEEWPASQPWQGGRYVGKARAIAWVLATDVALAALVPDPDDLGALVCAVDVPQNRRPGSYFWNSRGERVARMSASPPRGARPRRLRPPQRER